MVKKKTGKKLEYEQFKITVLKFKDEDLTPVNLDPYQCSQCPQCDQCPQG